MYQNITYAFPANKNFMFRAFHLRHLRDLWMNSSTLTDQYLYDAQDMRIFKHAKITGTEDVKEFYLRDAMGREIGILDLHYQDCGALGEPMMEQKWQWYVFGTSRFARVTPPCAQQPELPSATVYATAPGSFTTYANTTLGPVSFYVHDHLGNARVMYTPTANCGGVGGGSTTYLLEDVLDYYPYGKVLRSLNGEERYQSTHHERDGETGLDYRGARFYDSEVARFSSLDPMAAQYFMWSTYNYLLGNPISLIDPFGMNAWKWDDDGNLIAEEGDNAGTLAKKLGISFEEAKQRLSDQGITTNAKGILNLKVGDVFQPRLDCSLACNEGSRPQGLGTPTEVVRSLSIGGTPPDLPEYRAEVQQLSLTLAAGAGFTLGVHRVRSAADQNDVSWFYSYGFAAGFDASLDLDWLGIYSYRPFESKGFQGPGSSIDLGAGYINTTVGGDRGIGYPEQPVPYTYGFVGAGLSLGIPVSASIAHTTTVRSGFLSNHLR